MSYRLRSQSLDRYNGGDEQQSGRGITSAGLGGGSGRSVRTSVSTIDNWTSDDDITDSAWRRTIKSSSSSENRGQFASLSSDIIMPRPP